MAVVANVGYSISGEGRAACQCLPAQAWLAGCVGGGGGGGGREGGGREGG